MVGCRCEELIVKSNKVGSQAKLSDKELVTIFEQTASCTVLNLSDKASVYHQGSENQYVFLISKGQVKLSRVNLRGDQLTHGVLKVGDVFGSGLSVVGTSESYEPAITKGRSRFTESRKKILEYFCRGIFD